MLLEYQSHKSIVLGASFFELAETAYLIPGTGVERHHDAIEELYIERLAREIKECLGTNNQPDERRAARRIQPKLARDIVEDGPPWLRCTRITRFYGLKYC